MAAAAAEDLEEELAELRALQKKLEHHVAQADEGIEKILTRSWSGLEAKLLSCIDGFVDGQKVELHDRLMMSSMRDVADKPLEIDMAPLQEALENAVQKSFGKSRAGTDVALNNCMHPCRQVIRDRFPDPTESIPLADLPGVIVSGLCPKPDAQAAVVLRGDATQARQVGVFCRRLQQNLSQTLSHSDETGGVSSLNFSTKAHRILLLDVAQVGLLYMMLDADAMSQGSAQSALSRLSRAFGSEV
ncbi:hypothetical protein [Celeribacter sp.]|uniref:hypothetical protein n=1 Tax=Celeribacter sp. TaxID=1890673 RepID=UPI003A8EBD1D